MLKRGEVEECSIEFCIFDILNELKTILLMFKGYFNATFQLLSKQTLVMVSLMTASVAFGQQIPQYSQYINNQYVVNPAAAGSQDYIALNLAGRLQYAGFENGPKTSYLYFASPASKLKSGNINRTFGRVRKSNRSVAHPRMRISSSIHAFGAQLLADQYGPFRTFQLKGTYAYHLALNRDYRLSFGANLGISSRSFLKDRAQVLSAMTDMGYTDQTYANYTSNQAAQYTMDLDAGMYFYGKGAFAGLSVSQLTGDLVKFGNRMPNYAPKMHYMLTGGYQFRLNNAYTLTAATLMKYVYNAPFSAEVGLQTNYKEIFWFGAAFRIKDAVILGLGVEVSQKLRIGYSFDLPVTKMINYSAGGHELTIGLKFGNSRQSAAKI